MYHTLHVYRDYHQHAKLSFQADQLLLSGFFNWCHFLEIDTCSPHAKAWNWDRDQKICCNNFGPSKLWNKASGAWALASLCILRESIIFWHVIFQAGDTIEEEASKSSLNIQSVVGHVGSETVSDPSQDSLSSKPTVSAASDSTSAVSHCLPWYFILVRASA